MTAGLHGRLWLPWGKRGPLSSVESNCGMSPLKSFNQVHVNSQFFSSVWWRTFYTFNDAVRNLEYRTQTTECPTVCSPLQVVVNAKGKRRPVLDLRYVNHYLCQSKFKYEGLYLGFVYTTVTTFSSKRASFFYVFTACLHWDVKAKTNELESEAFQKCDEIVFMYMWKTKKHYS